MEQTRDIDLARERLYRDRCALVIVKQGELLFASRERGIKPIYLAVTKLGEGLQGASLADRVIGKAAALFCVRAQVKNVYANLISTKAIGVLKEADIEVEYSDACPYILNRNQDGMCPVEKIAASTDDGDLLLERIGVFLSKSEQGGT